MRSWRSSSPGMPSVQAASAPSAVMTTTTRALKIWRKRRTSLRMSGGATCFGTGELAGFALLLKSSDFGQVAKCGVMTAWSLAMALNGRFLPLVVFHHSIFALHPLHTELLLNV